MVGRVVLVSKNVTSKFSEMKTRFKQLSRVLKAELKSDLLD